jgi:hypothetical protein
MAVRWLRRGGDETTPPQPHEVHRVRTHARLPSLPGGTQHNLACEKKKMEVRGIEPRASRMRSERSIIWKKKLQEPSSL